MPTLRRCEVGQLNVFRGSLFRSPAFWAFFTIWLTATIGLAAAGHFNLVLLALIGMLVVGVWSGLTVRLTEPPDVRPPHHFRPNTWVAAQLATVLMIVIVTGHSGLVAHGALRPIWSAIPIWEWLLDALRAVAESLGVPSAGYILNPVRYFLIPAGLLLLLGARPRDLGLCRSHRWLKVTLLWSVFGVGAAGYALFTGSLSATGVAQALMRNALHNGFFEEFLFRGALLTRCALLFGHRWALALSSLAFGAWHTGAASSMIQNESLITALCLAIAVHTIGGLAFGVIFIRTRSLLAPSIAHVLLNLV